MSVHNPANLSALALEATLQEVKIIAEAARVASVIIEHHNHTKTRYMGARPGWDGTNEVNAASNDSISNFQLDAGNDTWGTAKCILGSSDTPVDAGNTLFDFHEISVHSTEFNERYKIRFAWGTSYNAAIIAGTFTEIEFVAAGNKAEHGPVELHILRLAAGTKVFAATWCDGKDTGTIDYTFGLHEYTI